MEVRGPDNELRFVISQISLCGLCVSAVRLLWLRLCRAMEIVASKNRHEFHEDDHCDLDVIGLKYNLGSTSLLGCGALVGACDLACLHGASSARPAPDSAGRS